ncbi:NUDIX domain-containing protein [Candidatus Saccharibacteria bacterium]|nr:NUDIX domain-containing protein [Candidatus Saccharibacteria bacterium]
MRRVTVRGIIIKDGKLFAQRLNKKDGGVNDYWCTPGGGLDDGELLHAGLAREMIEETGVAPVIGKLLFVQQYADEKREYLEFFFEITNVNDYEQIDLASTSHGAIEVAEFGFIDVTKERILPESLQQLDLAAALVGDVEIKSYL